MTLGSKNLQEDKLKKNDSTWLKLQRQSQRVEKKSPGSFIVSHKKHKVYIGVNLRAAASELPIIHYKPDWPRGWSQQS